MENVYCALKKNSTSSSTPKWQPLTAKVTFMLTVSTKDPNYLSNQRERKNPKEDQAEHQTLVLVLVFHYLRYVLL
jgi:hypothetical protein